jgi:hypothetical protein
MNAALWLEMDLRSLGSAVLLPEMPIGLHCKRAAIRVPEPSRDGWDIDSGLDAAGREKVPEIMMIDRLQANRLAGGFQRPEAAADPHNRGAIRFRPAPVFDFREKRDESRE